MAACFRVFGAKQKLRRGKKYLFHTGTHQPLVLPATVRIGGRVRNGEETRHAKFGRNIYGWWDGPFGAGLRCLKFDSKFQVEESQPEIRQR